MAKKKESKKAVSKKGQEKLQKLDLPKVAREINQICQMADYSAQQAGARLLAVKDHLPHGEFYKWIEDNLVITTRTCKRYMAYAKRVEALGAKRDNLSLLLPSTKAGKAKYTTFLDLDDEDVDDLIEMVETGEISTDALAAMSKSELRRALKREREDHVKQVAKGKEQLVKAESELRAAEKKLDEWQRNALDSLLDLPVNADDKHYLKRIDEWDRDARMRIGSMTAICSKTQSELVHQHAISILYEISSLAQAYAGKIEADDDGIDLEWLKEKKKPGKKG